MSLIPFPNIPPFPGVPTLARALNAAAAPLITAVKADAASLFGLVEEARWGVFQSSGEPVALADSFVDLEHSKEWRISDYPVEEGTFASFNKVEAPFDQRVTLAKGGNDDDRAAFLAAIDAAVASLDFFTVVTPEATYSNASLVRYTFRRRATAGVTLLLVDLTIRAVRIASEASFVNTQDPSGAAQVSGGTVQAQAPTAAQTTAAAGGAS